MLIRQISSMHSKFPLRHITCYYLNYSKPKLTRKAVENKIERKNKVIIRPLLPRKCGRGLNEEKGTVVVHEWIDVIECLTQ